MDEFEGGSTRSPGSSRRRRGRAGGEKETSEQAAIVARYADLFTRPQLDALREAEEEAGGDARESIARLRLSARRGSSHASLPSGRTSSRMRFSRRASPGTTASCRCGPRRRGSRRRPTIATRRARRGGARGLRRPQRRAAHAARRRATSSSARITGIDDPVARNEAEKGVALRPIADAVDIARVESTQSFEPSRARWLDRLLGPERDDVPASAHMAWIRRLSPLEATYTKERSVRSASRRSRAMGFDLESEQGIRTDLEDRPQKAPRACVIATDPPRLVHLITRAQGGVHDYEAFLHEAGHALHYAGCDPALPLAFRRLSRDHALTEIYSFLLDSIAREPAWHAEHFGLADDGGPRERGGGGVLEHDAVPPLLGQAGFRARVLAAVPDRGGTDADTRSASRRRRASTTPPRTTSRTWTRASTPPTTSGPGSARRNCAPTSAARSGRSGGGSRARATSCATSSARARGRRPRRSRAGSASTRSTPRRSSRRCARERVHGAGGARAGPTDWLEVDQERIDTFARATDDPQWIHVDPVRAAEGPFGTTIAHGYLTLSLCVPLMSRTLALTGYRMGINYGVNKRALPGSAALGLADPGRFTVQSVDEVAGGEQGVVLATVEREGGDKPVCVAELVVRMIR